MPRDGASASVDPKSVHDALSEAFGMTPISVAFVAALLFGPIVIATGLLTSHRGTEAELPGISIDALRQSLDASAIPLLHPSVDWVRQPG